MTKLELLLRRKLILNLDEDLTETESEEDEDSDELIPFALPDRTESE